MGIIIRDKEKETCLAVDITTLEDINLINKEVENILQYKNLEIEARRVWNLKRKMMPLITGETGIIFKITQKIPEQHTGKAWRQGTTAGGENADVRIQNIQHGK